MGLAFAAGLSLPMISAFMRRYPEIELELDFSDRLSDLIDEGFDVVIRGSELRDSRLKSRHLGHYRKCLVATPDYLKKKGVPVKPEELIKHACLHYRYINSGKLDQWSLPPSTFDSVSLALPVTMVCNSLDALLYMAKDGHGIACVPDFADKEDIVNGHLQLVLNSDTKSLDTFHIVWVSSRQMAPKVRVFVDFVIENFSLG